MGAADLGELEEVLADVHPELERFLQLGLLRRFSSRCLQVLKHPHNTQQHASTCQASWYRCEALLLDVAVFGVQHAQRCTWLAQHAVMSM